MDVKKVLNYKNNYSVTSWLSSPIRYTSSKEGGFEKLFKSECFQNLYESTKYSCIGQIRTHFKGCLSNNKKGNNLEIRQSRKKLTKMINIYIQMNVVVKKREIYYLIFQSLVN